MNADAVGQTIQSVIAPTVMISGCTLIQNAVLARYSGVGDRSFRMLFSDRIELGDQVARAIAITKYCHGCEIVGRSGKISKVSPYS